MTPRSRLTTCQRDEALDRRGGRLQLDLRSEEATLAQRRVDELDRRVERLPSGNREIPGVHEQIRDRGRLPTARGLELSEYDLSGAMSSSG